MRIVDTQCVRVIERKGKGENLQVKRANIATSPTLLSLPARVRAHVCLFVL